MTFFLLSLLIAGCHTFYHLDSLSWRVLRSGYPVTSPDAGRIIIAGSHDIFVLFIPHFQAAFFATIRTMPSPTLVCAY